MEKLTECHHLNTSIGESGRRSPNHLNPNNIFLSSGKELGGYVIMSGFPNVTNRLGARS